MSTPPSETAPPGWYGDPSGHCTWRWWDGAQWTDHTSTGMTGSTPMPVGAVPGQPAGYQPVWVDGLPRRRLTSEHQIRRVAMWAFALYGIVGVGAKALTWSAQDSRRQLYRVYRQALSNGDFPPGHLPQQPSWYTHTVEPLAFLTILTYVALLIWQYRAAATARAIGYPARLGPGLGVGSWFIPVVQLWFPYWALRDCLPPGHPGRRAVLRLWLFLLGHIAVGLAIGGVLYFDLSDVALGVLSIVDILCIGIVSWSGIRLVASIGDEHRRALYPAGP